MEKLGNATSETRHRSRFHGLGRSRESIYETASRRTGGVLDPEGGNEWIDSEGFRRRDSWFCQIKAWQGIDGNRNRSVDCDPMQRIRLRVICTRRGCGDQNLTARLMNAPFRLRGRRHGLNRHASHAHACCSRTGAGVRTHIHRAHVHFGGHGHGCGSVRRS